MTINPAAVTCRGPSGRGKSADASAASIMFDFTVPLMGGRTSTFSGPDSQYEKVIRRGAGTANAAGPKPADFMEPGFACQVVCGTVGAGDDKRMVSVEFPAPQPEAGHNAPLRRGAGEEEYTLEFLLSVRRAHLAECRRAMKSLLATDGTDTADAKKEAA